MLKMFAEIMRDNKIESLEMAMECEELWSLKNNRTLCESCHKRTDTYKGKGLVRCMSTPK
jgi:hypothetical protein